MILRHLSLLLVKSSQLIFEYLPTQITKDIGRLRAVCGVLPITKILIPSNPISKPHPDSLAVSSMLLNEICKDKYLKHIQVIPTLKASIHTKESLQSAFLTLQYLNIPQVAIISGDSSNQNSLTTYHALDILKNMKKNSLFLQRLNIFCALDSEISARNSHGFCKKLEYGVRNFITQPFYIDSIKSHNRKKYKQKCNVSQKMPHFLPYKNIQAFDEFLKFYKKVVQVYSKNNLTLLQIQQNVQIYCGFLPIFHEKQACNINSKKLGIMIPYFYMNAIKNDSMQANISLFNNLKDYKLSISYLHFGDIEMFLKYLK